MSAGESTTAQRDITRPALVAAELGVLAVGLGTAAACSRLFLGWGFMTTLSTAVVASWAIAVLTRRTHLGVATSALITGVAAVLVLTWIVAPETTVLGVPTPSTAGAVADAMRASFADFSRLVAPVEGSEGFLVVLAAVLWSFAWFADTAALRYRGPIQAVVPYTSAFIAVGVLSRDSGRATAAVLFGLGMAIYAVTQRCLTASRWNWSAPGSARGVRAVAGSATALVAGALVVGLAAGPLLPGDTDAVVDLRAMGRGGGTRTVVSPFVGVRSLLGPQSDQVVFTVQSPVPAYWRLTALGRYDPERDIWVSQGTYQEVDDGRLGSEPARAEAPPVEQTYEVRGLGGPWVPAAFVPSSIDGDIEVSYDSATASIITRGGDLETGDRFRIGSDLPEITKKELNSSRRGAGLAAGYLDTSGVSASVANTARDVTRGRLAPYQQAVELQNWFREGFEYDTDVDYRDEADPVAAFLDRREGFCQQFASAFALMARTIGLPARVAVGFTQGDAVGGTDGLTTYVVRGRHAHTWPEVHFDGIGWVPFEPTTGRGNPQAVDYTGIEPQQAAAPPEQVTSTTAATTTTIPGEDPAATSIPSDEIDAVGSDTAPTPDDGGRPWWMEVTSLAALAALAAFLVRRRHRRQSLLHSDSTGGRVASAWAGALTDLSTIEIVPTSSETPFELVDRVASSGVLEQLSTTRTSSDHEEDGASDTEVSATISALRHLATLETARRFGPRDSPTGPTPEDSASDAAAQVHRFVRSVAPRRGRRRQLASTSR